MRPRRRRRGDTAPRRRHRRDHVKLKLILCSESVPPQEVVRPVVAEAEPPPKRPPAFVRQVPELNHHVPQEVVAPEGVPVVDADPDLCGTDTVATLSQVQILR